MKFFGGEDRSYLERTKRLAEQKTYTSPEEQSTLLAETSKRLTDIPWQEKGEIAFTLGENDNSRFITAISITYNSDCAWLRDLSSFSSLDTTGGKSGLQNIRKIENIWIDHEKEHFDLQELIGDDWSIFINTAKSPGERGKGSRVSRNLRMMLIDDDPTSPSGLMSLFHEIGHIVRERVTSEKEDLLESKARGRVEGGLSLSPSEKASIIRNERFSEAFALGAMYRLLGPHAHMDAIKKDSYNSETAYHDLPYQTELFRTLIDKLLAR